MKAEMQFDKEIQNVLIDKYLKIMIPLVGVLSIFLIVGTVSAGEIQYRRLVVAISILAVTIVATIFRRLHKNRLSIHLFLLGIIAAEIMGVIFNGGFQSPAYLGLMAMLALTGWLFSSRVSLLFAVLYLCFSFCIMLLNQQGILPRPPLVSDFTYFLSTSTFIMLLYAGMHVFNTQLYKTLYNSRQNERNLAESIQKLKDSEELLRQTFDLFPIPVTITRATGTVSFHNKTFTKLFGYTIEDLPDVQTWVQTVYETPEYAQEMLEVWIRDTSEAVQNGTASKVSEHRILAKDGTPRIVEAFMQPVGETYVNIFKDVTEKRRKEEEHKILTERLHQSQKMEAIGQLAGGVAHDFNNALGGIIGAAELLKDEDVTGEDRKECLNLILMASDRAADLTKKLLTFSRKGTKTLSKVDCMKIVNDTAEILKHTIDKSIIIAVENRATHTAVLGDDSLLQNAIMNMGINSSHAMSNGGELTFTLVNVDLDEEYCEFSPFDITPGEYIEIAIRDCGIGMSPEVLARIFEPFFTTKELGKGTGLGMAAVYGTVQEHNGAIIVNSEVGVGTVFRMYLPVTEETVRQEIKSRPIATGAGTILVIDDEELIRVITSAMLRSMGYRVILATNGEEGVQTFYETKNEVDLIILDMIMPIMGGREALSKIREIDPTIPVIIASGFAKEEDLAELKHQGVNGFLDKPFRKAALAEMVEKQNIESKIKLENRS